MKTLKSLTLALILVMGFIFISTTGTNAGPRFWGHPVVHTKIVSKPGPNYIWVEGHYKFNKHGKSVWVPGHWKKV